MILVTDKIHLSPTSAGDADTLVLWMQEKEIYDNTIAIPYPYTKEDALTWLEDNDIFTEENGFSRNLAIRNKEGKMIGAIGLQYNYGPEADISEFGYWLSKPHWNQGIMTAVIRKFCEIAREEFHMKTLEAHVFEFNAASQKVLLKNGFTQHEKMVPRYKKDGRKIAGVKFVKKL